MKKTRLPSGTEIELTERVSILALAELIERNSGLILYGDHLSDGESEFSANGRRVVIDALRFFANSKP